jgi:hypothetical protein
VVSIWKHPESQYWTACFRDENGTQRRITTKETISKETKSKKALNIADEFESALKTKRILKPVKKVLDRLHEAFLANALVGTTFRKYRQRRRKPQHPRWTSIKAVLRSLCSSLVSARMNPWTSTRQDVAAVRDSLVGQVSAKTANNYVKALKMFFVPEERAPSLRILRVESQRFMVVSSNRPIAEARYQHGRPQHSNG